MLKLPRVSIVMGLLMTHPLEIGEGKGGLYILKSKSKAATSRDSFISSQFNS